jgi:hypothetical protein
MLFADTITWPEATVIANNNWQYNCLKKSKENGTSEV